LLNYTCDCIAGIRVETVEEQGEETAARIGVDASTLAR
jgi:hypothetical protein